MSQQTPPILLVKTWLQLLQSDMEPEAKREVERKINKVFGSVEIVIMYLQGESQSIGRCFLMIIDNVGLNGFMREWIRK